MTIYYSMCDTSLGIIESSWSNDLPMNYASTAMQTGFKIDKDMVY